MMTTTKNKSHLRLLGLLLLAMIVLFIPRQAVAHPSPNTMVYLDISPGKVAMEIQLPVPELALAFGQDIGKDPATIAERFHAQLSEYLLAHVHAYTQKDKPWQVVINNIKMTKGQYADSNIPYWEVNASISLMPNTGDNPRNFFLDYDVIIHQVINHAAIVAIRTDWETGTTETNTETLQAIGWNLADNNIPPLHINLQNGNWCKGFTSMVALGTRHIAEGTDHLLFLLVLLLPAPLLSQTGKWKGYGGARYSAARLLRIVTAFTIGHSFTLLLGALGWVQLPERWVEIVIAASILVSAIHAFRPLFRGKEIFVAGGFGLVHGMAFAATLAGMHLQTGPMLISILGFNIGIELMQLLVICITIPWLIILSRQEKVYRYLRLAGAFFAAVAATAWMAQRYLQQSNVMAGLVDNILFHGVWLVAGLAILAMASYLVNAVLVYLRPHVTLQRKTSDTNPVEV